jgi:hypothetical protein
MSYRKYYNLESYLFNEVSVRFKKCHVLEPLDLYFVLVWKANRSKNQTRDRLASLGGSFRKAAQSIARNLYEAKTPKERLRVLMQNWGFRLATGTARFWCIQGHRIDCRILFARGAE